MANIINYASIIYYKDCPFMDGVFDGSWPCIKRECPYWLEYGCSGCGLSPMLESLRKPIIEAFDKELADEYYGRK